MIPRDTINQILETARIEDVVSEFVTLKKRGSNLIGVCPFHKEKTPSFNVNPARNIFKCFGCGKAGDSVRFIMEHEHYSFQEALRYLAKKYGIKIEEREQTPEELAAQNERERMFNINSFAQDYFSNIMMNSDEGLSVGLSYFRGRGFRDAIINKFQLGYCPNSGSAFTDYAIQHGYDKDLLIKVGLTGSYENRLYDRYQGRVIFPIHNLTGKVIGFGGRILTSEKTKAKYVNSPESEIYNKSQTLYGIFFARNEISRLDNCILVEGYADVLSMHQAPIETGPLAEDTICLGMTMFHPSPATLISVFVVSARTSAMAPTEVSMTTVSALSSENTIDVSSDGTGNIAHMALSVMFCAGILAGNAGDQETNAYPFLDGLAGASMAES